MQSRPTDDSTTSRTLKTLVRNSRCNTLAWVMQNGESHVRNWYTGCKQCS